MSSKTNPTGVFKEFATFYSKVDTSKLQTLWIALYFQQIYIGTHVMKFKDPNADIN